MNQAKGEKAGLPGAVLIYLITPFSLTTFSLTCFSLFRLRNSRTYVKKSQI